MIQTFPLEVVITLFRFGCKFRFTLTSNQGSKIQNPWGKIFTFPTNVPIFHMISISEKVKMFLQMVKFPRNELPRLFISPHAIILQNLKELAVYCQTDQFPISEERVSFVKYHFFIDIKPCRSKKIS